MDKKISEMAIRLEFAQRYLAKTRADRVELEKRIEEFDKEMHKKRSPLMGALQASDLCIEQGVRDLERTSAAMVKKLKELNTADED